MPLLTTYKYCRILNYIVLLFMVITGMYGLYTGNIKLEFSNAVMIAVAVLINVKVEEYLSDSQYNTKKLADESISAKGSDYSGYVADNVMIVLLGLMTFIIGVFV